MPKTMDADIVSGVVLVILGIAGNIGASTIVNMVVTRLSGAFYPEILFTIIILCGLGLIYQGVKREKKEPLPTFKVLDLAKIIVALLVYVYVMEYIGFIISTFLFLMVSMFVYGERRVKIMIPVSIISAIGIYFLFTKAFMISLPNIEFLIF